MSTELLVQEPVFNPDKLSEPEKLTDAIWEKLSAASHYFFRLRCEQQAPAILAPLLALAERSRVSSCRTKNFIAIILHWMVRRRETFWHWGPGDVEETSFRQARFSPLGRCGRIPLWHAARADHVRKCRHLCRSDLWFCSLPSGTRSSSKRAAVTGIRSSSAPRRSSEPSWSPHAGERGSAVGNFHLRSFGARAGAPDRWRGTRGRESFSRVWRRLESSKAYTHAELQESARQGHIRGPFPNGPHGADGGVNLDKASQDSRKQLQLHSSNGPLVILSSS